MKLLTRRRRQLVNERAMVTDLMYGNIQSIAPGLIELTGSISNQWFLNFLTSKPSFDQLMRMHSRSIQKIKGVGKVYFELIRRWQKSAILSTDVMMMGDMVIEDAQRILGKF